MAEVRFILPIALVESFAALVPIQVFDHRFISRGRIKPGETVSLPAGAYAAQGVLPDGRELVASFRLKRDDTEIGCELKVRGEPSASRSELEPLESRMRDPSAAAETGLAPDQLRVWRGHWFSGPLVTVEPARQIAEGDVITFIGGAEPQMLEFGDPACVVVLPAQDGDDRRLAIRRGEDGGFQPEMLFDDPDLDLLLRYSGAGMLGQAVAVMDSADRLARNAFDDVDERPIAAAAGAYALLRSGRHAELVDWLPRMPDRFPWFADAWVLSGELAARQGRHGQALDCLLRLAETGLPFFGSGLSYAVNRLGGYHSRARRGADQPADPRLEPLFTSLQQVAARTDYSKPVLTYASPPARRVEAQADVWVQSKGTVGA